MRSTAGSDSSRLRSASSSICDAWLAANVRSRVSVRPVGEGRGMERDLLERYLDEGLSLPKIGRLVGRHPSTVAYWVKKHGLRAPRGDRTATRRAAVEACGYDRCLAALEFHHLDPIAKSFGVAERASRAPSMRSEGRRRNVCWSVQTAMRRSKWGRRRSRYSWRSDRSRVDPFRAQDRAIPGSSIGRCARLLTERLWVRLPPRELKLPAGGT
jgi:Helix-turn-helix domain